MKSQFEKWFEAQFGPREIHFARKSDSSLIVIQKRAEQDLSDTKDELTRRNQWDEKYQAASYAKNAAPGFEF